MSERAPGSVTGIFGILFREVGLFLEQTYKWGEDRVGDVQKLGADGDQRRLTDSQSRKAEAEARLVEQIRLAKQSGLDVERILEDVRTGRRG
jgi:hypothetical protein